MKRFLLAGLLALLIMGAVMPAAAASTSDLTQLATYLPANTLVYFGFRTDDAFFNSVDALVEQIRASIPNAAGSESIIDALDQLANGINPGGTYADTIAPVIGDFGAAGITSVDVMFDDDPYNNSYVSYLILLELEDGAALRDYFTTVIPGDFFTMQEGDGYTLFLPSPDPYYPQPSFYISDSLLAISNKAEALPTSGTPNPSLADSAIFSDALASMPQDDYNIYGYLNMAEYMNLALAEMQNMMAQTSGRNQVDPTGGMIDMLESMTSNIGGMGIGFTLLDGNSLTMDIGISDGYMTSLEDMGLTLFTVSPVDPNFASRVPSGMPLVIQGTNLAGQIDAGLENARAVAEQMETMQQSSGANMDFEQMMAQINFGLRGLTGLTLEEATSWMTGNYAVGLNLNGRILASMMGGVGESTPVSFGIVIENVDGGANALYEGLAQTIDNFSSTLPDSVTISTMDDVPGNGSGTSIQIEADRRSMPFPITLELVVNDDIFAFGTQDFVQQALSADGGLASDAAYQQASSIALLDTGLFWYLSTEPLLALVEELQPMMNRRDGETASALLSAFESATISGGVLESGEIQARLVITLGE